MKKKNDSTQPYPLLFPHGTQNALYRFHRGIAL